MTAGLFVYVNPVTVAAVDRVESVGIIEMKGSSAEDGDCIVFINFREKVNTPPAYRTGNIAYFLCRCSRLWCRDTLRQVVTCRRASGPADFVWLC